MDIGRIVAENWPYKVAAIVLSVLLWLSVSAERARTEQIVPTRLELQVADSAWSLREARSEVMTTFRSTGGEVFASIFPQPRIVVDIDSVSDPVMQIQLSPSDVIYNAALGVVPTAVEPSTVTIRLEERSGKWVAVRGRTDARAEPGAVVVGTRVAPDSVWLQGPATAVGSIDEVTTELLAVGAVSAPVARQLAIELPPDLMGLEVRPDRVLASVEVDVVSTRRFQRAVTAVGPFAEGVRVSPATVTVEVTGAAATVDALQPLDLGVTVRLDEAVRDGASYRVRVELPPDVTATTSPDPARVTVTSGPAPSAP